MDRGPPRAARTPASSPVSAAAPSVAFFNNTFEEAMALTREARDYLTFQEKADLADLDPVSRMVASCESMRVTARLTQVVAWLLVQRAVHAGEIPREQAKQAKYRLSGREVCAEAKPVVEAVLPDRLMDLLCRSLSLYERVARLDRMLDGRRD